MTAAAEGDADGETRLVTTELAALAAGVSPATIRKWSSRGKITRYGSSRRALYDLTEIMNVGTAGSSPFPDAGT
ncbi:helix-turn-helix domain-containing protein [Streptomyces huiliensis]|uniref:helix-turn-helix domain-containing protein n=1 Tax=Streptomyces huiliensis TaxID=2876027 RepID=UPI001CBCFF6B|nr:helix-turn-helix domain-containing protein [Streptomyces huiliensis]MBZ4322235.1 helix-turn-helix domain-containing protein [Streptomyces huiliensis]